jgi:hypothetical protein
MSLDGFLRNTWTVILGTGGRFPPEQMDTFAGIGTTKTRRDENTEKHALTPARLSSLEAQRNAEIDFFVLSKFRAFVMGSSSVY